MHKQDAASQNDLEIAKRDLAILKNKLARIHLVSWFKYLWKWRGKEI